uniref:Uncharacterized protein n=1 Tax=virus sp. ctML55 TaxID=2827627 RepID=A0A8S5RIB1_9VIRU|nr:MAG TPA: hypothetical protein [virus sp. ctML55]
MISFYLLRKYSGVGIIQISNIALYGESEIVLLNPFNSHTIEVIYFSPLTSIVGIYVRSVPNPIISESVTFLTSSLSFLFFQASLNPNKEVNAGSVTLPPNITELCILVIIS